MIFKKFFIEKIFSEIAIDKLDFVDEIEEKQINQNQSDQQSEKVSVLSANSYCPECSTEDCISNYGNIITFTDWVRIPKGYIVDVYRTPRVIPEIMYNTSCLKYSLQSCMISGISVPNPCNPEQSIVDCSVRVNKIKLTGCLKYLMDLYYYTGNPGSGHASPSTEGVLCIDQTIGYTGNCNYVVPENVTLQYTIGLDPVGPLLQPNDDTLVPIIVTLTFTL